MMTRYRDRSFSERVSVLGDTAEGMFAELAPLGKFQRLGWRRPDVTMRNMEPFLRHLPDFYTETGFLVEVMGLGHDGILKLKVVKYEALSTWNKLQPTSLFLWNSHTHEWCLLHWKSIVRLVGKARRKGVEKFTNDGNEYFPIEWVWIEEETTVFRVDS